MSRSLTASAPRRARTWAAACRFEKGAADLTKKHDVQSIEPTMADLEKQVALVTGASRGVGRGVALALANAGANVFATGRSIKQANLSSEITTIACDHTDDEAVAGVFRHVDEKAGGLNILVNVAWSGYERMVENGQFTWS